MTLPQSGAPAQRRATLADVARLANVSLKTASRALGGEPYVSEKTRTMVFDAAQQLDYQRNAAASLLASGRLSESVGLITGDFTNPFYSALAKGLEDVLRERDMHLSVANARESAEDEWRLARSMADRQTKAVVVVSAMTDHSRYRALQARGVPVVFVDRPAEQLDADSVVLDNRGGGRSAARHLLEAGHRRIAFIGDYEWLPTFQERAAGMAEVLAEHSGWHELVRPGAHDVATARRFAAELLALPEPPSAFIAGNNRIVLGVMEELASRGATDRPAVVSFDDFEWARVLGISVVAHDPAEMGRRAAHLALDRLARREQAIETVVLPMRLITRGSGERPPVR